MAQKQDIRPASLVDRMVARKADLVARWADLVMGSYPEQTRKVWTANADRFANPVGVTIRATATELFDLIVEWEDASRICAAMEQLVKIRTVQDFAPSAALAFVFQLKKVLREAFAKELEAEGRLQDLMHFETRIDNVVLMALDLYCANVRQVYDLRVKEVRLAHRNVMRRAKMVADVSADEAEKL